MRGAKPFLTFSDEGTRKEQPPSDMVMKTNSPFMRILTALARVMTPEAVPSFPKPTSIRTIYHPVRSGVLAVLWLCCIAGNINAADFVAPADRITVAILAFTDKTGNPGAAHWRHSIPLMAGSPLGEVKTIRIYPTDACEYGMRRLNLKVGDPIDATQARNIGEIIEARRVVWGEYRRNGKRWAVKAHVLNVASGNKSGELSASGSGWLEVCEQLAVKILQELDLQPTKAERDGMKDRFTSSAAALEHYSRSYAIQAEHKPLAESECWLRKAVAADPKCAALHISLACCLGSQGREEEAEREIHIALKLKPESAMTHQVLGVSMLFQDDAVKAGNELREAIRLDPDDPESHSRLAGCHAIQHDWAQAVSCLREALRLNPVSVEYRAQLAGIYANQGQRTQALLELRDAEALGIESDTEELLVSNAYEALHEIPQAVEHYEKFLILARGLGTNPKYVNQAAERMLELKATLTPVFVTAAEPKVYSEQMLNEALRDRLSEEEMACISLPLASTPEMKRWAEQLTEGAADDLQKARALYHALIRRLDQGAGGSKTALETFAAWEKPQISFLCQEYARLYVALARDVGLKAYYVIVERDCGYQVVLHACAGILLDDKALLVDPTYRWFGAPHKQFVFQDDYQAVVNHMNQSCNVSQLKIAVKLQPDCALSQFNLALNLMEFDRLEEARDVLETALKLDPDSWIAHCARGVLARHEGRSELAMKELRVAVGINPRDAGVHFALGLVLWDRRQFKESREAFRACLKCSPNTNTTQEAEARQRIALINEKFGAGDDWDPVAAEEAATELIKEQWKEKLAESLAARFEIVKWTPMVFADVGLIYDNRPEPRQLEIEDLNRRAASDPEDAACRYRLWALLKLEGRKDESGRRIKEAEEIYRRRLEVEPENLQALTGLALCLCGTDEGGRMAKRATELAPRAGEAWLALARHQAWQLKSRCLEGFGILPDDEGAMSNIRESLMRRARSEQQSQAIFDLGRDALANCLRAVEVAPVNPEVLLRVEAIRREVEFVVNALHEARGESAPDQSKMDAQCFELMEKAAQLCRDKPEALAAVTIFQFVSAYALLPKSLNGIPDHEMLEKRQAEVLTPVLARLREMSDSPDAAIAAPACEAYGALLSGVPSLGGLPIHSTDLPARLARAVRLDPRRCLAWDLLIYHTQSNEDGEFRGYSEEVSRLSEERARFLKTGRSHAMVGLCSGNRELSKAAWEEAVKLEPENLEYLLNLAAISLRCSQLAESRDTVSGLMEKVSDLWYDDKHLQRQPALDSFRLRIFAVMQALGDDLNGARNTVNKMMEDYPDDLVAQRISILLEEAR